MLSSGLRRLGRPAAQLGVRCVGSVPEKNPDNIAKVSYMIIGTMEQIRANKWMQKREKVRFGLFLFGHFLPQNTLNFYAHRFNRFNKSI